MTSTYLEPEEMEDFVKHHVQQQSGFNNVDRDEAFANLTQIWLELGTFDFLFSITINFKITLYLK